MSDYMKAITLWQPWASLVAIGAKRIETRSWHTHYRGPIAIHAAKRKPESPQRFLRGGPTARMVEALLEGNAWAYSATPNSNAFACLPRGCIIAIAELVDVKPVSDLGRISSDEQIFGNFQYSRFGWILGSIKRIVPIPAIGHQGLWNWKRSL